MARAHWARRFPDPGGGIILALAEPEHQKEVAAAMEDAGGRSYIVTTGAEGVRIESDDAWANLPE